MRSLRSLVSPLAAAALVIVAGPVAAQQLVVASDYVRPAAARTVSSDDAVIRKIAVYRFARSRDAGMPSEVTIADSAGTIIASYLPKDGTTRRPMNVDTMSADLLLQADTRNGPLTLVIYQMSDPVLSNALLGRWMLGDRQGELLRQIAR